MARPLVLLAFISIGSIAPGCSGTTTRPTIGSDAAMVEQSKDDPHEHEEPFILSFGNGPWSVGPEIQIYPAGVIAGVQGRTPLNKEGLITFRVAYNATDRQDFGEHDDETGGGPGFGAGYRHYFGPDSTGWLLGGRVDLWFLEIDWEDDVPFVEGTTDVIVLQPTVEGGYGFAFEGGWRLDVTVSVGAEINVDEDGEDVGEGAIGLLGIAFVRDF